MLGDILHDAVLVFTHNDLHSLSQSRWKERNKVNSPFALCSRRYKRITTSWASKLEFILTPMEPPSLEKMLHFHSSVGFLDIRSSYTTYFWKSVLTNWWGRCTGFLQVVTRFTSIPKASSLIYSLCPFLFYIIPSPVKSHNPSYCICVFFENKHLKKINY